jgi:hypothetical protein
MRITRHLVARWPKPPRRQAKFRRSSPDGGAASISKRCGVVWDDGGEGVINALVEAASERAQERGPAALTEGFSHFVASVTAPVASGWSGCRVGLTPTGKRRLSTAHTRSSPLGRGWSACRQAEQRGIQPMCGLRRNGQSLRPIAELMKAVGFFELAHFRAQKNIEACHKTFLAIVRSLLALSPGQRWHITTHLVSTRAR